MDYNEISELHLKSYVTYDKMWACYDIFCEFDYWNILNRLISEDQFYS